MVTSIGRTPADFNIPSMIISLHAVGVRIKFHSFSYGSLVVLYLLILLGGEKLAEPLDLVPHPAPVDLGADMVLLLSADDGGLLVPLAGVAQAHEAGQAAHFVC